ncbi:hyperosmotically inducible protein [Paucidesulfovibrio gracilis DSM 16080]|uniref:Hyperosmotically inducible protein n=1 Tax=Paucidesulfovibrio gracilis DSM 16080 TaxID=1121449 RepID=A0A1T4WXQ0_9BACT|nr:BON domain-containing protein [Paucidesulfovibrio gracilis]SKA82163.1 hyperosmotically inducible protein [Paucidesulfovibrio gracilis DSM 16080]
MLRLPLPCLLLLLLLVSGCVTAEGERHYSADPRPQPVLARDRALATEILGRFADEELVGLGQLKAHVYNGHVYLVGEYESEEQRRAALDIVTAVAGSGKVTMRTLPLKRGGQCSDSRNNALARDVTAKLIADSKVHGYTVEVRAMQCREIVLLGLLSDEEEIARATSLAARVPGVQQVDSLLNVFAPQP